jgi:hypothetical protein
VSETVKETVVFVPWIDETISFARGDSYQHLADLSPRDRNTAELGARRAISYLVSNGWIKDPNTTTKSVA